MKVWEKTPTGKWGKERDVGPAEVFSCTHRGGRFSAVKLKTEQGFFVELSADEVRHLSDWLKERELLEAPVP